MVRIFQSTGNRRRPRVIALENELNMTPLKRCMKKVTRTIFFPPLSHNCNCKFRLEDMKTNLARRTHRCR